MTSTVPSSDTKANLTWLTNDLATGGDLSFDAAKAQAQVYDILDQDVDVIIDIRVEASDEEVWASFDSIKYVHLPTTDAVGHHIPAELFDAAVLVAREARAEGKKVFVHCHMGINRGPSVAYAILLDRGYGITAAFDLIRRMRPVAGIYYAKDALRAHHDRQGSLAAAVRKDERLLLERHMARVMDAKTVQHVMRAIAEGHQRDNDEWRRSQ